MRKNQTYTINEEQFNNLVTRIVSESVKLIMTESDWKTYANAAKKRLQQYRDNPEDKEKFDKFYDLQNHANKVFDDEYVGNYKYDTFGDKAKGKHSPKFDSRFDLGKTDRMPYSAVKGYNKGGDKLFSTEKGVYHSSNGITTPRAFFRDKEVADAYSRANDELWDYENGNYEYEKGKGWVKKGVNEEQLKKIATECVKLILKEGFRKPKVDNYDDGSEAYNFNDSLERTNNHLEKWCEEQMKRYSDPVWGDYGKEQVVKPVLLNYIRSAQHKDIRTKDNATNYAWRVANARFAMRLAKRYGIELGDEWNLVNEVLKRLKKRKLYS